MEQNYVFTQVPINVSAACIRLHNLVLVLDRAVSFHGEAQVFFHQLQRYLSRHCATIRRISLVSFYCSRLHVSSWIADSIKAIVIFIPSICECIIKFPRQMYYAKLCNQLRETETEIPRVGRQSAINDVSHHRRSKQDGKVFSSNPGARPFRDTRRRASFFLIFSNNSNHRIAML